MKFSLAVLMCLVASVSAGIARSDNVTSDQTTKPGVTILPGEIASHRFAEGVTDLGFDPDWEWHALVCRKKCELEKVKLLMTPVKVQPYDGEPLPGHTYAIDRELDAPPLMLFRDLPPGFQKRPETFLHAGLETYPSSTPGTLEIDLVVDEEVVRVVPRYAGLVDNTPMFKVYLETKTNRQLLTEVLVDSIVGTAGLPRRQQMLRWAGDLDGDDKLDLVMTFTPRYGEEAAATLFLSSLAKPGEMVGMAGAFSYWPVGNPGC